MPTGLSYRLIARNVGLSKNTVMETTNYIEHLLGPAQAIDPSATAKTHIIPADIVDTVV